MTSRPVRARGLKHPLVMERKEPVIVAPRAGAWIETIVKEFVVKKLFVAPRAGAWIETQPDSETTRVNDVAPRAGAWIETRSRRGTG